ncbi:HalOD1 output domain-containing protein [Halobium salinum]|uniref:HalOD1 output domain-containing protein n=1 Tax=Halobium salinum TaxID=1364940 RepID=A0ABD5PHK6_9EURY|nr:HalOD1 output domain-containing protein [Halobium salinum]
MGGTHGTQVETVERFAHGERLGTAVVEAVAEATGIDPLKLDTRLYDVVDPDGLEQVFGKKADGAIRTGGRLTFELAECEVTVYSEGRVVVTPP